MSKMMIIITMMLCASLVHSQTYYKVKHLDHNINTNDSETGGTVVDDTTLIYTSMMEESSSYQYILDFNPMLTQLFQSTIKPDGTYTQGELNLWGLNAKGRNSGNVAYDAKRDVIYFSRKDNSKKGVTQIYYSQRQNGRWSKALPMEGNVNLAGHNSTHPAIGHLPNGETILYFSSDRPGGIGGYDIWYAIIISAGKPGNSTNLGAPVNTDSNEVTPFYSEAEGILYFSSNRSSGLGGFDIYSSAGTRNTWQQPVNMGEGLNSKYNDLFFTVKPCRCQCIPEAEDTDPIVACGFLTSNRKGSYFSSDSNCCNDIYQWSRYLKPQEIAEAETRSVNLDSIHSAKDLLPLPLYFHNDEPDPRTLSTTTELDYTTTWRKYMKMKEIYMGAQPNPIEQRKRDSVQKGVNHFFDHELKEGHENLMKFLSLMYADLQSGLNVEITVNGFASPLFEDEYNQHLSERRIASLRNEIVRWNNQALLDYLNNGKLWIRMVPLGATESQNGGAKSALKDPNNVRSTYDMEAAHARRIEISEYRVN